ncbi:hypothetical protein LEP1GSC116_3956 [Leptospira interrogans serovar Icterohaemorrhagiae str. Verdun HP]|uniref:Uncharacterized protein n=1 Tax=Leptospira interrogans serovar Icterohaemorrhagiae str. Verdun HP TaxID=1049910 RepID=M6RDW0_LEPIR|nr:hypothetical protein LEP1GSC116_3956 [Leptospira interrogans serovar Icterohaemorrhagiae str. Verdun HP]
MIFNSAVFIYFFLVVLAVCYFLLLEKLPEQSRIYFYSSLPIYFTDGGIGSF